METLVVDIETTFQKEDGRSDNSPYNPLNKIVSVATNNSFYWFGHSDVPNTEGGMKLLQQEFNAADLVVGHNLKFDMSWLYSCGVQYDGEFWDTMIHDYVRAKGRRRVLSLSACCERYGIETKTDEVSELWKQGITTDNIPPELLKEYNQHDVHITEKLYQAQLQWVIANYPPDERRAGGVNSGRDGGDEDRSRRVGFGGGRVQRETRNFRTGAY